MAATKPRFSLMAASEFGAADTFNEAAALAKRGDLHTVWVVRDRATGALYDVTVEPEPLQEPESLRADAELLARVQWGA